MITFNERHLPQILQEWVVHYNRGRPHASLGPGIPDGHVPELASTSRYRIRDSRGAVAEAVLGGLQHEYRLEPLAA